MANQTPTPMTSAERAQRAAQVSRLRADGVTWEATAERVGVSVRQAQRLQDEHRRASSIGVDPGAPDQALAEALSVFEWGIDSLADLAEDADNSSAAVAAVSRRCDLAERRLGLLASAGLVPRDQAGWRIAIDLPSLLRAILDVAERRGLALAEIEAEFARLSGMPPVRVNGSAG
jgi:hypothetical protein